MLISFLFSASFLYGKAAATENQYERYFDQPGV